MNAITRIWHAARDALDDERARAGPRLKTDEAQFLPAAMEIIETPVSPTGRVTAWVLMIGLVATILWLTFGTVDVVASAPGKLIPLDSVKLIQPADAGVVRAIFVHDGQHVRAGEALVQLDPTVSTAEAAQAAKALQATELDVARDRAVLSSLDGGALAFAPPPGTPADIAATELALGRATIADLQATADARRADRAAAAAAFAEARVQAAKLTETLPLLDEQIAANEQLLAKGYVSKLKVIEMRRQRLSTARDRDAAVQTAARAAAQMAAADSAIAQARAEARAKVLGDLTKADADAKLKREEVTKAAQKSSLRTLVSPVDGTVAQLAVHTVGGVVEAAKPIMVIVPSAGGMIAEVKIPNRDIGFIHVGQQVAIKLEAFSFTRYGTLRGRVDSLGSDAVEDEKLGLVYPARITIDAATGRRGGDIHAAVGMQLTADIRTGQRSILSYLLSPVDEAAQEAGRER